MFSLICQRHHAGDCPLLSRALKDNYRLRTFDTQQEAIADAYIQILRIQSKHITKERNKYQDKCAYPEGAEATLSKEADEYQKLMDEPNDSKRVSNLRIEVPKAVRDLFSGQLTSSQVYSALLGTALLSFSPLIYFLTLV